ncbi:MAG: hypothetical protein ACYSX0_07625 [Planctomycetota bacterium]|jgi:ribosomal protein S17E
MRMPTVLLCPLAALALALPGEMEQRFEQKVAKDFVKNADWVLDYDAVRKTAKDSRKLIFGYFTRSFEP